MGRRKQTNLFDRWEPLLLRLAIGSIAVLLTVQLLLYPESSRRFLSRVDRLEGDQITWRTPLVADTPLVISEGAAVTNPLSRLRPGKAVVIRMVRPAAHPEVYALVNGERVGHFADGETKVTVFDGDYLEIDASRLPAPGQFVVSVPGGGLTSPAEGLVVEGRGATLKVGKVKFKH